MKSSEFLITESIDDTANESSMPYQMPIKSKLHTKDGTWFIDSSKNGLNVPVEDFGIKHVNGIANFYYFRNKDGKTPTDYNKYFVHPDQAKQNIAQYTYRNKMEIGIKEINLQDLKISNQGKIIMFLSKKARSEPGTVIK